MHKSESDRIQPAVVSFIALSVLLMTPTSPVVEATDAGQARTGQAHRPAVAADGWRRTNNGWEHTSTWKFQQGSINQLIAAQHDREPAWIRAGFSNLRSIPPLMYGLLQICAAVVIIHIAGYRRRRKAG